MAGKRRKKAEDALLHALACGASAEAAANQCGVDRSTVNRRLRDPEFKRRLHEMRAEMVDRTAAMLSAAGCQSVSTLLELQRAVHPPAARLAAAKAVLEKGMKIREAIDYEKRISALEQQLGDAKS